MRARRFRDTLEKAMRKVLMLALLAPLVAYAMTYYLEAQWTEGGNRFCRYGDGTVLNVGYKLCPLSIKN